MLLGSLKVHLLVGIRILQKLFEQPRFQSLKWVEGLLSYSKFLRYVLGNSSLWDIQRTLDPEIRKQMKPVRDSESYRMDILAYLHQPFLQQVFPYT